MQNDTIVGIATGLGAGGVAIVRLSGPEAVPLFERVFRARRKAPPYADHLLMLGDAVDGGAAVDECMGVAMYAPHSYTREDVCELHTHGGAAAAQAVVALCLRLGARLAEPGEFTRRAFENGRIDLSQAEAVMGVVEAASTAALRAQEALLAGGASRFIRAAQAELIGLLAGLEAHIDYPDEVSEREAAEGLLSGVERLAATLREACDERSARIVREGLRVALCGAPNAGKSTLFNALLGEERAIVTAVAGTTRDALTGTLALDGVNVCLTDTAGLRDTDDEVERIGVERARRAIRDADAVLLVLDAGRPLTPEEAAFLKQPPPCPCAVALNKGDLPPALTAEALERLTAVRPILPCTAAKPGGAAAVRAYLRELASVPLEPTLVNARHIAAARQALERLQTARQVLADGAPADLAAIDLQEALFLLGTVTGDEVTEGLLDEIFSRFCVGK